MKNGLSHKIKMYEIHPKSLNLLRIICNIQAMDNTTL